MKPHSSIRASLRPTIFLGLGGTGHDIILRVKRSFVRAFKDVPPFIAFLGIDVAEPENGTLAMPDGEGISLNPSTERHVIQVPSPSNVIGDHNPHIKEWWPENTFVSAITAGATQIRPRGRLALFAKYSDVRKRLKDVVDQVSSMKALAEMDERDIRRSGREGVEVFIVSSIAGGTGSGMAVDMAFNVRELIDPASNVTGALVLPRIFDRDSGARQKPNSYAALKEIEFFMKIRQGDSYFIDYGGDRPVRITRPPFDLLFLLDGINEMRGVISDKEDLFDLVAEGIFMQVGSQLGTRAGNIIDNIKGELSSAELISARSASYCSFGIASLSIDEVQHRAVVDSSKAVAVETLVDEILGNGSNDKGDVDNGGAGDVRLPWDGDSASLLSNLTKPEGGAPVQVQLRIVGLTDDRSRIDPELAARYSTAKSSADQAAARGLELNGRVLEESFSKVLEDWVERKMNSANALYSTAEYLRRLGDKANVALVSLRGEIEEAERQTSKLVALVNDARASLQRETGSVRYFFGGKERVRRIKSRFEIAANEEIASSVSIAAKKRLLNVVKISHAAIEVSIQKVEDTIQAWERVRVEVKSNQAQVNTASARRPFEAILPGFNSIEDFKRRINPSDFINAMTSKFGSAINAKQQTTSDLAQLVREFVDRSYGPVVAGGLDSSLEAMLPEERSRMFKRIADMASPLWYFDDSKLPLPHKTLMETWSYGVFDADNTNLRKMNGMLAPGKVAPAFVSLFDPYRITLLRIRAGVPLFALEGVDEMEHAYQRPQIKISSHMDKRFESFPGVVPFMYQVGGIRESNRLFLLFNLAAAPNPFALIDSSGVGGEYLLWADRSEGVSHLIGKSRQESFAAFRANEGYVKVVENLVRGIVSSHSEADLKRFLRATAKALRDASLGKQREFSKMGEIEGEVLALEEVSSLPSLLDLLG